MAAMRKLLLYRLSTYSKIRSSSRFTAAVSNCSAHKRRLSSLSAATQACKNSSTPGGKLSHYTHIRCLHTTQRFNGKVVPFLLSDIGEGIREVVVKEWFISEGDHVDQFDPICEVQSDKASVTITSRYDGVVTKRHYEVDDTALVGDPLVDIELSAGAHDSVAADQVDDVDGSRLAGELESELAIIESELASDQSDKARMHSSKSLATPAVRRIASENKIQLSDVVGTGKDGRILKEDVLAYISNTMGGTSKQTLAAPPSPPVKKSAAPSTPSTPPPSVSQPVGEDTVITLKGIKRAMAKSMSEALLIPHFGYYDEIDMSQLVLLRTQLKGSPLLGNVPFSYMPVIIKATSLALRQFPILNSSMISEDQVVMKAAHNIGFAMDSPEGLIVPNIKNVQNLTVLEVAEEMYRLISLGEQSKLGQNDITGGTFSLSNIGSIGGTYAKPVILAPQAAIGALGKIQALPRFDDDDNVVKAHIMRVSWSADHRIIEGAQMARFSNLWKSYLEQPASLVLNMK